MIAEVFGNPSADWSLILYVGNQPVSVLPENQLFFNTRTGQKTTLEVSLDLSDFQDTQILYAVFYARNWHDPAILDAYNRLVMKNLDNDQAEVIEEVVAGEFLMTREGIRFSNRRDNNARYLWDPATRQVTQLPQEAA